MIPGPLPGEGDQKMFLGELQPYVKEQVEFIGWSSSASFCEGWMDPGW